VIRRVLFPVMALFLVAVGPAAVDAQDQPEPPVRLKKKEKPKPAPAPEEKKPQPPGGKKDEKKAEEKMEDEPELTESEQAEKELLDRVAKNMRDSEDRLAKKDTGDSTRQVQRDIVKDLDALIRQEQQSSQQQNQQQNQQQGAKKSSRGQRIQQVRRRSRSQKQQQASRNERQSKPDPQQANSKQGGMGQKSQGPTNKLADLYKDVWGHLPEMLRMEMDAYSREQFMAKYDELLKKYYSTIAEKGRRKGE